MHGYLPNKPEEGRNPPPPLSVVSLSVNNPFLSLAFSFSMDVKGCWLPLKQKYSTCWGFLIGCRLMPKVWFSIYFTFSPKTINTTILLVAHIISNKSIILWEERGELSWIGKSPWASRAFGPLKPQSLLWISSGQLVDCLFALLSPFLRKLPHTVNNKMEKPSLDL